MLVQIAVIPYKTSSTRFSFNIYEAFETLDKGKMQEEILKLPFI